MELNRYLATLLLPVVLLACRSQPVADTGLSTIYLYQPQWSRAVLLFRPSAGGQFTESAMARAADGWWQVQLPRGHWQFAFTNGAGRLDLGHTRGCYSGSHFACADDSVPEPFSAGAADIWVKDGLLYNRQPDHPGRGQFTLLTLNLHAYQEFNTPGVKEAGLSPEQARERVAAHGPLFDRMAQLIEQLQPDAICLQEVAEWGGEGSAPGFGAHETNAIRQLQARLRRPYFVQQAWSHYAWDVWKEGTAVLSRYPLLAQEARYISRPGVAEGDWRSRKVSRVRIHKPGFAPLNIYSVHAGWWGDEQEPFAEQFARLQDWLTQRAEPGDQNLLCGDFNQPAGGPGYRLLSQHYRDSYLQANPDGMYHATIGGAPAGEENRGRGQRIDYVWLAPDSHLTARIGQRVFTEQVYGRVSDHLGLYLVFEPE